MLHFVYSSFFIVAFSFCRRTQSIHCSKWVLYAVRFVFHLRLLFARFSFRRPPIARAQRMRGHNLYWNNSSNEIKMLHCWMLIVGGVRYGVDVIFIISYFTWKFRHNFFVLFVWVSSFPCCVFAVCVHVCVCALKIHATHAAHQGNCW